MASLCSPHPHFLHSYIAIVHVQPSSLSINLLSMGLQPKGFKSEVRLSFDFHSWYFEHWAFIGGLSRQWVEFIFGPKLSHVGFELYVWSLGLISLCSSWALYDWASLKGTGYVDFLLF